MSAVDIPVMPRATGATRPLSYQQVTQSTRPCPLETSRASNRAEHFADWDTDTSKPDGFVCQLMSAHAPASIIGRFGEAGFDELGTGHIAHGNEARTPGTIGGRFVRPVLAGVLDFGVDGRDPFLFAGTLRHGQLRFRGACHVLTAVDDAIGAGDVFAQSQVNTDLGMSERFGPCSHCALQVDVPTSACVLTEAPGLDGAFNRTRQPQAKDTSAKADCIPSYANGLVGEGNPAERPLAGTPGQTAFTELMPSDGVFHADTLDGLGGQSEIVRCAFGQNTQIVIGQPTPIPTPGQYGDLVADVPHPVDGPGHAGEVRGGRAVFDAVLVRKDHSRIISRKAASFLTITLPKEKKLLALQANLLLSPCLKAGGLRRTLANPSMHWQRAKGL